MRITEPEMTTTQFLLIRHGESEANAGLPTPSPTEIRLTRKGREQAAAVAEQITERPDLIVTSPYLRTQETAEPFIRRHPEVPDEIWPVQEFTYLDIRRHAGTTEAERGAADAEYWSRCDPLWKDGEGAESFTEFCARIDTAIARIRAHTGKVVAVFAHGYVIHAIEMRLAEPDETVGAGFMNRFITTWPTNAPAHCEVRRCTVSA